MFCSQFQKVHHGGEVVAERVWQGGGSKGRAGDRSGREATCILIPICGEEAKEQLTLSPACQIQPPEPRLTLALLGADSATHGETLGNLEQ